MHLLPTFDIASIEEDPAQQATPDDTASYAPDGEEQQACIEKVRGKDAFNWGYDPWHFNAPRAHTRRRQRRPTVERESPSSAPWSAACTVTACGSSSTRCSTTAASGQGEVRSGPGVPGYYHRLNASGAVETSTCCQNIATEHQMAQKLMVDSVVLWARDYKVDGFRFDLMGHHSRENMLAVRTARRPDGGEGRRRRSVGHLYGEGWNFGEVANNARFTQATQGQLGGTQIGAFSDRLRDAVRGGGPFDETRASRASAAASSPTTTARTSTTTPQRPRARHRPGAARPRRQPALVRVPQQRVRRAAAR